MLRTRDLDYLLPPDRIATHPPSQRTAARLMVVEAQHRPLRCHTSWTIAQLPEVLSPGDLLVVNSSRVLPAWLTGCRTDTLGRVEGLYIQSDPTATPQALRRWHLLVRGSRLRPGVRLRMGPPEHPLDLTLISPLEGQPGGWLAQLDPTANDLTDIELLTRIGSTPIPPYIRAQRKHAGEAQDAQTDAQRYQTVFAAAPQAAAGAPQAIGSIAAPTAGLHFSRELLDQLAGMGVGIAEVELHVGVGTFKSVETEFIEEHPMHAEWCRMSPQTRDRIAATRSAGKRVVCVGTTAARTVESVAGGLGPGDGSWFATRILITPGYPWRWTDALLTNFHLPRSTLMAMVASFLQHRGCGDGVATLHACYARAVRENFRFYSYGDAMLIV